MPLLDICMFSGKNATNENHFSRLTTTKKHLLKVHKKGRKEERKEKKNWFWGTVVDILAVK